MARTKESIHWCTKAIRTLQFFGISSSLLMVTTLGCGGAGASQTTSTMADDLPADASKPAAPSFTSQPTNLTVSEGSQATFSAGYSSIPTATCQWQKNNVDIAGATAKTFTLSAVTLADSGSTYRCVATNRGGSSNSTSATLTVTAASAAPVFTLQPVNRGLYVGSNVTFSVDISGTPTPTCQWQKNNINISGATAKSLTLNGLVLADSGSTYRCIATNSLGSATSAAATLTVITTSAAPAVILQPVSQSVTSGSNVTFLVDFSGTPTPACQWQKNSVNISGATAKSLTLNAASLADSGSTYRCVATNTAGSATSAVATLTVTAASAVPVFTLQPINRGLFVGSNVTFSVDFSGTPTPTCQWQKNSVNISGATAKSLTINALVLADSGSTYRCVATNSAGSVISATATLTVTAASAAPAITIQPVNQSVTSGSNVTFSVNYSGVPTPTCQWQKNGINMAGATASSLSLTSVSPADSGSAYRCTVTNSSGVATSNAATLSVLTDSLVDIVVSPTGSLQNPGTAAAPTTLDGARLLLRKVSRSRSGPLRVWLHGGSYYFPTASFTLTSADCGTEANPIEYLALPNETPRIIGGAAMAPQSLHAVDTSDPNWTRLDPATRSKIYVADLSAFSSNLGTLTTRSDAAGCLNSSIEVFTDGQPLTLARYPKAVDPEQVNLAPQIAISVTGSPVPDVTGTYAFIGLDSLGRPYYQLAKGGNLWSIAASASGRDWILSNRRDLGGTGTTVSWGNWESFAGPAGYFAPNSGAKGGVFLARSDTADPMPGFHLVKSTNGTNQILSPDSRMSRWNPQEAMFYGYGYYDWAANHSSISSLDGVSGNIQLADAMDYGLRAGQPFFFYNLLEELTAPGEYFVDRVHARLYMRPVGDVPPSEILVSLLQSPLISMQNLSHLTWQGIVFELTRNKLVDAQTCQTVAFQKCQFRNSGSWGLLLSGSNNLVDGCTFTQLGKGGIYVCGGNRTTLTPSHTVIQNSEFHHYGRLFWTNQPAIMINSLSDYTNNSDCAGITVQHNEIHHAPHNAIVFKGNNHSIRYNHIHHVCQWSSDAGAIYTGRDWGAQGNLIQFNLIRECGSPFGTWGSGIYVDGCASGVTVEGNILYRAAPNFAIQHNGGRDVIIRYNIMVGHEYGLDTSNVGFSVIDNVPGGIWNLLERIEHFNYQTAPWSTAYPALAAMPDSWTQIQGSHWIEPENSVFYGNLHQGLSADTVRETNYAPAGLGSPLASFKQNASNLSQKDPLFVDPANLDFRLQSGSPMYSIPGFPGIDAAQIGIQH
jgi:hypothetical protein